MHAQITAWQAHRFMTDRLQCPPIFPRSTRRILFLSEEDSLCRTQLFPFFYYRRVLAQRWNVAIAELPLAQFEARWQVTNSSRWNRACRPSHGQDNVTPSPRPDTQIDAVAFQTWFDRSEHDMEHLIARIRVAYPSARLAYLDWFAPTDLRYASVLEPHIHAYLKKQILRDHTQYGHTTQGDTNLTDYYGRRFGLSQPESLFRIPERFFDKLILGPSFFFSPHMLPKFRGPFPQGERPVDVNARFAVNGTEWYNRMRQEALDAATSLKGFHVLSGGHIPREVYFSELSQSKMCFSPFGYGEVAWRDYEAAFSGALLVKPDSAHLDSRPNLFRSNETYAPVRWDLSDFKEVVRRHQADPSERLRITQNAFDLIRDYIVQDRFLDDMTPFFYALLN